MCDSVFILVVPPKSDIKIFIGFWATKVEVMPLYFLSKEKYIAHFYAIDKSSEFES